MLRNYFLRLLAVFVIALGVDTLLAMGMDKNPMPLLVILAPAHAALTGLQHLYVGASGLRDQVFIRRYMGINTLKLFLYLVVIVVFFLRFKSMATEFTIRFMVQYAIFLVFETVALYLSNASSSSAKHPKT